MAKKLIALVALLALACGAAAMGEVYEISDENELNFGRLLINLLRAYETPSDGDQAAIESVLNAIGAMNPTDREVAEAIADHWMNVYANADYPMFLYDGGKSADALKDTGIPDSATHAFVVLGFELKDGEMQDELKGRCDAAGAAATAFPRSLLICSGGPTGHNNPKNHTEAGMMKDYLTGKWGVDGSRVLIDERARTTLENAVNTFAMMREAGVETYTIVTSSYHQKWGQAVYNCMAEFYRQAYGYDPKLVSNYSYDIEPIEKYQNPQRFAIRQLCALLDLPDEVLEGMKQALS